MNRVTLYTSIPPSLNRWSRNEPYGEAYQRECINSWREAGFRTVSLNSDAEIESLRGKGFDVEFLSNGSPNSRTKIGAFLSAIGSSDEAVTGVINADCYLMNPGQVIQSILDSARGSLVAVKRLDVDPATMRPTGSCFGIDAFFFDTSFAPKIADGDEWSIGEPFWDYWFPLAMHIEGAQLKEPDAPILIHLIHEQQWQFETSNDSAAKLWRRLISAHREPRLSPQLAQRIGEVGLGLRGEEIDTEMVLKCIVPWLVSFPERIRLCLPGAPGDLVCRMLTGLASSDELRLKNQLEAVTFAHWLRSKQRSIRRVRDRVRSRLRPLLSPTGR